MTTEMNIQHLQIELPNPVLEIPGDLGGGAWERWSSGKGRSLAGV